CAHKSPLSGARNLPVREPQFQPPQRNGRAGDHSRGGHRSSPERVAGSPPAQEGERNVDGSQSESEPSLPGGCRTLELAGMLSLRARVAAGARVRLLERRCRGCPRRALVPGEPGRRSSAFG
ncbi:Uhrf1-Binding Protein 1-Like, partial [Manis pentadactyla]